MEQGGKKEIYLGTLQRNKKSGCVKCGDKIFAEWERNGDILELVGNAILCIFMMLKSLKHQMT